MRTFLTGGATMSGMNIDIAWLLPKGYASRGIPGHCMVIAQGICLLMVLPEEQWFGRLQMSSLKI